MIRTLIVDDEPLARRHLRDLLVQQSDIEVLGEAAHGAEAIRSIRDLGPDLVFLDVQMPEVTGFDVIATIGSDAMPTTIFVTAYDAFALQAFEVDAVDYLLKPFSDARFHQMLERARRRHAARARAPDALNNPCARRLVARQSGLVRLVRYEDIQWISAAGNYSEAHLADRTLLIDETLTSLAARLPSAEFARIHRSTVVRLEKIAEVRAGQHGDGVVRLLDGPNLRLSRRYRSGLMTWLRT